MTKYLTDIVPPFNQQTADAALSTYLSDRTIENRSRVIEANIRQAFVVIGRIRGKISPEAREDLGVATQGLIQAIEHFDPKRGTKFSTYAYRCIRNQMIKHLVAEQRKLSRIGVPFSVVWGDAEDDPDWEGDDDSAIYCDELSRELPPDVVACQREAQANRVRRADVLHAIKMAMGGDKWRSYRLAMYLKYIRGMDYDCVGRLMGVTKQRTHALVKAGIYKVRAYLKQCGLLDSWGERYRDWVTARSFAAR